MCGNIGKDEVGGFATGQFLKNGHFGSVKDFSQIGLQPLA